MTENMNENTNETQPVTIGDIDTLPELDAYHADTGGVTGTMLRINPDTRSVDVLQRGDLGGHLPEEWYSLIWTEGLDPRPDQDALSAYLHSDEAGALLAAICDGHYTEWGGNNMRGNLNAEAGVALDALLAGIGALPESDWVLDNAEDWLYEVDVELGADIEALAEQMERDAAEAHVVLYGDIAEALRGNQRRQREARIRYGTATEADLAAEESDNA